MAILRVGLVAIVAAAVIGCATTVPPTVTAPPDDEPAELPGTAWVLISLDGAVPILDARPSIAFALDGSVAGSAGCNQFSGTVAIDGTAIAFGPIGTTKIGCEAAVAAQESAFLDALAATTTWAVGPEGRLTLSGGRSLVFDPA
jgi:heat shock protein HslJ